MATASPPADRSAVVLAFAQVLRQALERGADRATLDELVSTLGHGLGYHLVTINRLDGDVLRLVAAYGLPQRRLRAADGIPVGVGRLGEAASSGEAVVVADATSDPGWVDASDGETRSGVFVPMRLPGRLWGVLAAEHAEVGGVGDEDVELLAPLADVMAWALESERLRVEADERARREQRARRGLEAIASVITAGLEASEPQAALERMTREIRERFGWDNLAVLMLDDAGRLAVRSHVGWHPDIVERSYPTERGILGHVATTGRPYLATDVLDDPFYDHVVSDTRSEMCAPLVIAGRVRGLMNVESPVAGRFGQEDLDLLVRTANQVALVLHNIELLSAERETVARLHELDAMKSRFLSIASHELRTPLTVVMGFAEVLVEHQGSLAPGKLAEFAEAIGRQAAALSSTVDQMLVAAQLEQGQLDLASGVVELHPIVEDAVGDRPIEILPGVEGQRVLGDAFRLQQVLENLCSNAVKFAPEGRIQLDARRDGSSVRVLLRDEGPGIPGHEHDRVFEAFHQHGEAGVAGRRGVGLGLAIARDLVRRMGGDLQLASAPGYGATFVLRLPAAPG